jgi:predicted nucleotidyltransferase
MLENYNTYKILQQFFDMPTHRFQIREISRITKISLPSVINHLRILEKEGFVKKVKNGVYHSYTAVINDKFRLYKKLDLIRRLHESRLVDYLEKELSYPSAIVLFGSGAEGEDMEKSDIDIFIIAKEKDLDLAKFEKMLKRSINLHFFGKKDMKIMKRKNPELLNNIINGIVLYGYLKVF